MKYKVKSDFEQKFFLKIQTILQSSLQNVDLFISSFNQFENNWSESIYFSQLEDANLIIDRWEFLVKSENFHVCDHYTNVVVFARVFSDRSIFTCSNFWKLTQNWLFTLITKQYGTSLIVENKFNKNF